MRRVEHASRLQLQPLKDQLQDQQENERQQQDQDAPEEEQVQLQVEQADALVGGADAAPSAALLCKATQSRVEEAKKSSGGSGAAGVQVPLEEGEVTQEVAVPGVTSLGKRIAGALV
eukprot:gene7524-7734_t